MPYESESPVIGGNDNNVLTRADLVSSGVKFNGSLDSASDVDHYRVITDGPALISVQFSSALLTTSKHWAIELLNASGDVVKSVTETVLGTPLANKAASSGSTTLVADGFRAAPPTGSRFTLSTSGADSEIYTVVSASSQGGGAYELTLDKALKESVADNAALSFDPAQTTTGTSATLATSVTVAGSYYIRIKVDGTVYNPAEYGLTTTVIPTVESEGTGTNDTLAKAIEANNRLVENAPVTGALSSATDVDVYTFSTAAGSDFTVSFASNTTAVNSEFKIEVKLADGTPLPNNAGVLTAGTSASVAIDDANFANPTTFMVTVSATSATVFNTDAYTLKVSGTGLNLNDSPAITVGALSGAVPNALVDSGVTRVVSAGNTVGVPLSSLVSATDGDANQTVAYYRLGLDKATGVTSDAAIRVGSEGSFSYYGFGAGDQSAASVVLTAAQLATAVLLPRTTAAGVSLTLYAQAFDSTSTLTSLGGADQSGASSVLSQKISVVAAGFGVTLNSSDIKLTLSESSLGEGSAKPNSTTFTLVLTQAPTADVKVYLQDGSNQLDTKVNGATAAVATFTSQNWSTAQTITVTPTADGKLEGASQAADLSFLVVSADATFDGFTISKLGFVISDNAAPSVTAPVAMSFTDTITTDTFAAPTSGSLSGTLAATDANGETLTYGVLGGTDADSGSKVVATNALGTLTVTKATGAWTFAPSASGMNALGATSEGSFTVTVSDGTTSGTAQLVINVLGVNDAPSATFAAAAVTEAGGVANATAGTSTVLSAATLADAEGNAVTVDTAALVAGGWTLASGVYTKLGVYGTATLTPATGAVTYALSDSDADTQGLKANQIAKDTFAVALVDELGAKSSVNFEASVTGANDAPAVAAPLEDQQTRTGARFTYQAKDALVDVDKGDTLTYEAELSDGSSLPTFLKFDPASQTFSGRAQSADVGTYSIVMTATDAAGASISDTFELAVAASEGIDLSLTTYHWKSHALISGVSVANAGDDPILSSAEGLVDYGTVPDLEASLTVSRTIASSERAAVNEAVDLQDAIAILKMIVQLDVNGANKPLSAYQSYAADFDGNGEVDLNDAIAVLKHIVGLQAPTPEWVFFHDGDATIPGKAGTAPGVVPTTVDLPAGAGLGLVGVLRGDVDGSWQPPANTPKITDQTPSYFTDLVDKVNASTGKTDFGLWQFGIYPAA